MARPELIEYITNSRTHGTSDQEIVTTLTGQGWQTADITEAMASAGPAPVKTGSPKSRSGLIVVLVIVVLLLAGGAYAYTQNMLPFLPSTSKSSQIPAADLASYSSASQGYGFSYLKTWKTSALGTLTTVTSPETQATDGYKSGNPLYSDVLVSSNPYYTGAVTSAPGVTISGVPSPKTHDEQTKDLAEQMTPGKTTPTTVGSLKGYLAITESPEGSTVNIVLTGTKATLLIQFPNVSSLSALSTGQKAVLDSFVEVK